MADMIDALAIVFAVALVLGGILYSCGQKELAQVLATISWASMALSIALSMLKIRKTNGPVRNYRFPASRPS